MSFLANVGKPIDPSIPLFCHVCGWEGKAEDAWIVVGHVARCPMCVGPLRTDAPVDHPTIVNMKKGGLDALAG